MTKRAPQSSLVQAPGEDKLSISSKHHTPSRNGNERIAIYDAQRVGLSAPTDESYDRNTSTTRRRTGSSTANNCCNGKHVMDTTSFSSSSDKTEKEKKRKTVHFSTLGITLMSIGKLLHFKISSSIAATSIQQKQKQRRSYRLLLIILVLSITPLYLQRMFQSSARSTTMTTSKTSTTKTTLVIMGYSIKRLENYKTMFPAYGEMEDVLDKVIFLWNNLENPPPTLPSNPTKVPIHVIPQSQNSMNNRFGTNVTRLTETPCITLADDDVLLSEGLIRAMIDAWEGGSNHNEADAEDDRLRRPIVGVDGDSRVASTKRGYLYPCNRFEGWVAQTDCLNPLPLLSSFIFPFSTGQTAINRPPNLVIGKTMTFSTRHIKEYQNDKAVWHYTSPEGGHYCEDIIMNALIRNATKLLDPVFVRNDRKGTLSQTGSVRGRVEGKDEKEQVRYVLDEAGGLSWKGLTPRGLYKSAMWQPKRSECVGWASNHYGYDVWASS